SPSRAPRAPPPASGRQRRPRASGDLKDGLDAAARWEPYSAERRGRPGGAAPAVPPQALDTSRRRISASAAPKPARNTSSIDNAGVQEVAPATGFPYRWKTDRFAIQSGSLKSGARSPRKYSTTAKAARKGTAILGQRLATATPRPPKASAKGQRRSEAVNTWPASSWSPAEGRLIATPR